MIRIKVSLGDLRRKIRRKSLTWLKRAHASRTHNANLRRFDRDTPEWGDIKYVYVRLQGGKCAYCERSNRDDEAAMLEWDIDHYRPKGQVTLWRSRHSNIACTGGSSSVGYYKLGHDPRNYVATCKTCNTYFKQSYFPIAGSKRRVHGVNITSLNKFERPLMLFPLGDLDVDPETVITYLNGFLAPAPVLSAGQALRDRVLATVEILALDAEVLQRDRAREIFVTYLELEHGEDPTTLMERARKEGAFAGCVREFIGLYQRDRPEAVRVAADAKALRHPR